MSVESETKKLLEYREVLEGRVEELMAEVSDLKSAISELDKMIVGKGFRTLSPSVKTGKPAAIPEPEPEVEETPIIEEPPHEIEEEPDKEIVEAAEKEIVEAEEKEDELVEGSSITSKDGTVLGKLYVSDYDLTFRPLSQFHFTSDIPPFKSFLVDRVLQNMRNNDEERASKGELGLDEVLSFNVVEDGEIVEMHVTNYGGERRLREITSSLRWTFDKMNDKLKQG
jgi:hypothetical protein